MNTGARLAGITPPALPAVDDTSFADAKKRVETALVPYPPTLDAFCIKNPIKSVPE
jgi:hypothetical protein